MGDLFGLIVFVAGLELFGRSLLDFVLARGTPQPLPPPERLGRHLASKALRPLYGAAILYLATRYAALSGFWRVLSFVYAGWSLFFLLLAAGAAPMARERQRLPEAKTVEDWTPPPARGPQRAGFRLGRSSQMVLLLIWIYAWRSFLARFSF